MARGDRVRGSARVGDRVTYFDMANQNGTVWEVIDTAGPGGEYRLRDTAARWRETTSDLRQHGWGFAR